MSELVALQPVDYLAIGHLAVDLTPAGSQLGGSVAYAALTAQALGMRVGVVTSFAEDAPLQALSGIQIVNVPSQVSTTFENFVTENGRKQRLYQRAEKITFEHLPPVWRDAAIIHLAPIAQEMDVSLAGRFPASWVGVTPQGWMRAWDEQGQVRASAWENSQQALGPAGCVVLSIEDVERDLEVVEDMAQKTKLLCLTEGALGSVLYWNGDRRRFRAPAMEELDATGAGDIFAAALFTRLLKTRDPWEAARFATQVAAYSVTRYGLDGIPTQQELELCAMEVLW